jgi:uncharacterized protein
VAKAVAGVDVVIVALPAIDDQGTTLDVHIATLLEAAKEAGARIGIAGGAGSLHVYAGGPKLEETLDFPDFLQPVAAAHRRALDVLAASDGAIDWFYLTATDPAATRKPALRAGRGGRTFCEVASYLAGAWV